MIHIRQLERRILVDHIRDIGEFQYAMNLSRDLLNREYLTQLKALPLMSASHPIGHPPSTIRLIKLEYLSQTYSGHLINRVTPLLGALNHLGAALGYILNVSSNVLTTYLAVKSSSMDTLLQLIQNTLNNKDSHVAITILAEEESQKLLDNQLFNTDSTSSLSSVIINPSQYTNQPTSLTSSTLSRLLEDMAGEDYTILFLANSADKKHIADRIYQLENLFSLLDTFKETTFTHNKALSESNSNTLTRCDTQSDTCAVGELDTKTHSEEIDCKTFNTLIVNFDVNETLDYAINTQVFKNNEIHDTYTHTHSLTNTNQNSLSKTTTDCDTHTKGNTSTFYFKGENKTAIELLKKTEELLTVLYHSRYLPQFNLGVYFIAPYAHTTLRATFTYLELLASSSKKSQENHVHTWSKDDASFNPLLTQLSCLDHPHFIKPYDRTTFSPTELINSKTLSELICIPPLNPLKSL